MHTKSEQQLLQLHSKNESTKAEYRTERNLFMGKTITIAVLAILVLFLGWLSFVHYPQNQFLWTSDARSVCKATTLDHASVHQRTIAQFAGEAALALNSYDFLNYRLSLTWAGEKYLTKEGRNKYFNALDETSVLELVKKNYYVVSSFVSGPPQIAQTGFKGGVPFWNVQVPIDIWYATGQQRINESRTLTMTVVVVDPSPENTTGIAIENIVSSQRVNK